MTDRELNICLREMARNAGLCDEWYNKWSDDDSIDMCIERFIEGIDFTIDKRWVSIDFITKHFDRELLHKHHVYVNENVNISDADSGVWVFLGTCTGEIRFEKFSVGRIYVLDKCNITINAREFSKAFVSIYDDSSCLTAGEVRCKKHKQ